MISSLTSITVASPLKVDITAVTSGIVNNSAASWCVVIVYNSPQSDASYRPSISHCSMVIDPPLFKYKLYCLFLFLSIKTAKREALSRSICWLKFSNFSKYIKFTLFYLSSKNQPAISWLRGSALLHA